MTKIGLALSGGGIKAFSQLPIIEAIEKENLKIDYIAGTSMGAALAALYASGCDAATLKETALEVEAYLTKTKLFLKPSLKVLPFSKDRIVGGVVDGVVFEQLFEKELSKVGVRNIKDVKIPLAIPSVDIVSGKLIVFVSHPHLFKKHEDWDIVSDISLAKAVRASCSFPFVISLCEFESYYLSDGGIKMNFPVDLIKAYGAKKIVGVTMHHEDTFEDTHSLLSIGSRVFDLMIQAYDDKLIKDVDVLFNIDLKDMWVFDFGNGHVAIEAGESHLKENTYKLKALKERERLVKRIFTNKKENV